MSPCFPTYHRVAGAVVFRNIHKRFLSCATLLCLSGFMHGVLSRPFRRPSSEHPCLGQDKNKIGDK